jgi:cytoskeleton protein RodZ
MEATQTLGERLKAGRQERQLTLADVAERTKINPLYLRAMEQGEIHLLPARVYVRGYVRSLGLLLGLEPADLYSMLPSEAELTASS